MFDNEIRSDRRRSDEMTSGDQCQKTGSGLPTDGENQEIAKDGCCSCSGEALLSFFRMMITLGLTESVYSY